MASNVLRLSMTNLPIIGSSNNLSSNVSSSLNQSSIPTPSPIPTEENYISFVKCPSDLNFIPGKSNIVFLNISKNEQIKKENEEKQPESIDICKEFNPPKVEAPVNPLPKQNSKNILEKQQTVTKGDPQKQFDNFYPSTFRLRNITIYETRSRYYLVGSNGSNTKFRVLKLDRRTHDEELGIAVDSTEYNIHEINRLLVMIKDGNYGGLKEIATGKGIMGFIRFTHGYHLIYITKKRKVGTISCHKIYAVEAVGHLYIPKSSEGTKDPLESRYKSLFFALQMTDFYFSYTFDLTHSLQHNMSTSFEPRYDKRFVWNHYLLKKLVEADGHNSVWVLPLIHGYFGQKTISLSGRLFKMSIIARRSRHFAGTRFLKRGVNGQGRVANDVETEQIIEDCNYASLNNATCLSSYVQIRGSIPLFWGQDPNKLLPKPPIYVQRCDPFYAATKLHFQDLLCRFGRPTVILNLIKEKEKKPRESLIRKEFQSAVEQINGPLPIELKIHYLAWDFSKASKSDAFEVITEMTNIAENSIYNTGFFLSGPQLYSNKIHQSEYDRVSCSDFSQLPCLSIPQIHTPSPLSSPSVQSFNQSSESAPTINVNDYSVESPSSPILMNHPTSAASNIQQSSSPVHLKFPHNLLSTSPSIISPLQNEKTNLNSSTSSFSTSPSSPSSLGNSISSLSNGTSNLNSSSSSISNTANNRLSFLTPANFEGKLQNGVLRSNCIDSLDRTNAAQFVAGKVAFGYQLFALGLSNTTDLDIDDEITDHLMDLYQEMGNALALQYGGSHLAHTMNTYTKTNTKTLSSQSRDMIASLQRYYSNSFNDKAKQDSINLFLGNFKPFQENTNLWDLETDYYLHMKDPSSNESSMLSNTWCEEALLEFITKHNRENCVSLASLKSSILRSHYEKEEREKEKEKEALKNNQLNAINQSSIYSSVQLPSQQSVALNNASIYTSIQLTPSNPISNNNINQNNQFNSPNNYSPNVNLNNSANNMQNNNPNYNNNLNKYKMDLTPDEIEKINLYNNYFDELYCLNRITSFDKLFKQPHSKPLPIDNLNANMRRPTHTANMNAATSTKMKRWMTLRNNINSWKNKRTKKHQISDWDPFTEAHPDFYLTKHLTFVVESILGPSFNSLSLFKLTFEISEADYSLYNLSINIAKEKEPLRRPSIINSTIDEYEQEFDNPKRSKARSGSITDIRSASNTIITRKKSKQKNSTSPQFDFQSHKSFYESAIDKATNLSFISSSSYYPTSLSASAAKRSNIPKKYEDYVQFSVNAPTSFQEIEVNPRDLNCYISTVYIM